MKRYGGLASWPCSALAILIPYFFNQKLYISFIVFYSMKYLLYKQCDIVENYPFCYYKYVVGV